MTLSNQTMKLIIQIPAYNEEKYLADTLRALPREVPGFDSVEWLVINDGSTDSTGRVAKELGVDHMVSFATRRGLARAFMAGVEASITLGADVIVNTDADNQYDAACIGAITNPILDGTADLVIGARPISYMTEFSPIKKALQRCGTWVVRRVSGTTVQDATSGFRAIHRDAAMRMNVFNSYTYTLETIIQAGRSGMAVKSVPVKVNKTLRPSRLVRSNLDYVVRSVLTILRIFVLYKPLRFFAVLSIITAAPGVLGLMRYLILVGLGKSAGHVQSLLISGTAIAVGAALGICGLLCDQAAANRALLEDLRMRAMRQEISGTQKTTRGVSRSKQKIP